MKKIGHIYAYVILVIALFPKTAHPVTNFYSSGIIQDEDSLGNVYTWNNAVVDMTGGIIQSLDALNYSTFNLEAGVISEGAYIWNESTLNMYDGNIGWSLEISDSGTANLYGGFINYYLYATGVSIVNIHGYGFNYDPDSGEWNGGQLSGFWLNGSPFSIDLLDNIDSTFYNHVVLYEIPEPASLLLFGLGAIITKKR